MKRPTQRQEAFTLVEFLAVLGIVALGWAYLASVLGAPSAAIAEDFESSFAQLHAKARLRAQTENEPVIFGLCTDGARMALGKTRDGVFVTQEEVKLGKGAAFVAAESSVNGTPNHFAFGSDADNNFWRLWTYEINGAPAQAGGILVFDVGTRRRSWKIAQEGALVEE